MMKYANFSSKYKEEYFRKLEQKKFLSRVLKKAYQRLTLTPDGKLIFRQERKQ